MMPQPEKQLLCFWHVDRVWKGHINTTKDKNKREEVYKMLRIAHKEVNKCQFNQLFDKLLEKLLADVETLKFGEYLINLLREAERTVGLSPSSRS